MQSITSFDNHYPVRTFFSDNADWQNNTDWQKSDRRKMILQDYLCVPLKQIIYARETHSGHVLAVLDESYENLGATQETSVSSSSDGYDAMVTAISGVLLCVWTADCFPLFLYDSCKHVAAVAHCGWRGICKGIVSNTIDMMTGRYDASLKHIIAAFGPGICGKCYEVSDDLITAFSNRFSPNEIRALFQPKQNGKYLLNLRKAIGFELSRIGVLPANITDEEICSYESVNYASYRRNGHSEPGKQTLSGIVLF